MWWLPFVALLTFTRKMCSASVLLSLIRLASLAVFGFCSPPPPPSPFPPFCLDASCHSHESCGQCTPCREGTPWMEDILTRMEYGKADFEEIPMLEVSTSLVTEPKCCIIHGVVVCSNRKFPVKLKATPFVLWAMLLLGQSRASSAISRRTLKIELLNRLSLTPKLTSRRPGLAKSLTTRLGSRRCRRKLKEFNLTWTQQGILRNYFCNRGVVFIAKINAKKKKEKT